MPRHWSCSPVLAAVLALTAAAPAADRAVITGRVVDSAGKPVGNANVIVYSASVKSGYSTFCPTCYTDCGKRARTGAAGQYRIASLDPALRFQLLVVREGYEPLFVPKVDPAAGPAPDAALSPRPPVDEPARLLHGRVVTAAGRPLRDALIRPEAITSSFAEGRHRYDNPLDADRLAVTDSKGEFEIHHARPAAAMTVMVEARGMAPKRFRDIPTGATVNTLTVADGALVRGRLTDHGRPVAGAEMILSPRNHMSDYNFSEIRMGTQKDGAFVIPNVPLGEEWYLSAAMQSIAARGALQPRKVVTGKDAEEADLGDLTVQPGLRLRGRVQLSDGKAIPAGVTVRINQGCLYCAEELAVRHPSGMVTFDREFHLSDFQSVPLPPDGRFEFAGLPSGPYIVIAAVQGYESAAGSTVLAALDLKPEDHALWSRQAESGSAMLKRECAVEIRIDHDLDGLVMKLQPAPLR